MHFYTFLHAYCVYGLCLLTVYCMLIMVLPLSECIDIDSSADVCHVSLQQVRLLHHLRAINLRFLTQFATSCGLPLLTNHSTYLSSNQNIFGDLIPSLPATHMHKHSHQSPVDSLCQPIFPHARPAMETNL